MLMIIISKNVDSLPKVPRRESTGERILAGALTAGGTELAFTAVLGTQVKGGRGCNQLRSVGKFWDWRVPCSRRGTELGYRNKHIPLVWTSWEGQDGFNWTSCRGMRTYAAKESKGKEWREETQGKTNTWKSLTSFSPEHFRWHSQF